MQHNTEEIAPDNAEIEPLTNQDIMQAIESMLQSYDGLPQGAMLSPCTQYDLQSILLLLKALASM